jgi:hypothetical protein
MHGKKIPKKALKSVKPIVKKVSLKRKGGPYNPPSQRTPIARPTKKLPAKKVPKGQGPMRPTGPVVQKVQTKPLHRTSLNPGNVDPDPSPRIAHGGIPRGGGKQSPQALQANYRQGAQERTRLSGDHTSAKIVQALKQKK